MRINYIDWIDLYQQKKKQCAVPHGGLKAAISYFVALIIDKWKQNV